MYLILSLDNIFLRLIKTILPIIIFSTFYQHLSLDLINSEFNKINGIFFIDNNSILNEKKIFDKWIVIIAFNPPSSFIINLEKSIKNWKIVVVGSNKNIDIKWNIFNNSKNLFYLSIEEQKRLKYNSLKYLKENSYFRKTIGYLYAIQNGANEIYEIDEGLEFKDISDLNSNFFNTVVSYGVRNDSIMINPYSYFGEPNIWPRGFRLNEIGKQSKNKFYYINSRRLNLKPLIFQGLIGKNPDIDSIFFLTRKNFNNSFNFNNSKSYPLIYFPNNYVPINSKNTRYSYEIFPLLMFPISLNENIADIWRGYIMQNFIWKNKGIILYYNSDAFKNNYLHNAFELKKDKKNYFEINKLLDLLNSSLKNNIPKKYSKRTFLNYFNTLFYNKILKKQDKLFYKAFLKDLIKIGYNFSIYNSFNEIKNNINDIKTYSEFEFYKPSNLFIIKNKSIKLINHVTSNKVYNEILLIINYNHKGFLNLNDYLISLYQKNFPNIIFIYPSKMQKTNIISCEESYNGYYSYKCFEKVYNKYPKYKGYLYINDDVYLKVWELENLNFNIPWLYQFHLLNNDWLDWIHYNRCIPLNNMIRNNVKWKKQLIKFNNYIGAIRNIADFYYLPNYYAFKLKNIFNEMFKSRIFLECAVPTSMGILSTHSYQIIYLNALWKEERKNVISYLYSKFNQITIHPIKFSFSNNQKNVNKYIFFINAINY